MDIIDGLKYSKEHEWIKIDGNKATVGISDHAQDHLGEIVFVELPDMDVQLEAGDVLGAVESLKAASDVYTPVSGKVTQINEALIDNPELINAAPYENWIAELALNDLSQLEGLMDAAEYEKYCAAEE